MKNVTAVVLAVLLMLGFACFTNAAELEYVTQQALVLHVDNGSRVILRFANEVRPAKLKGVMASWKGAGGECFTEDSRRYLAEMIQGKKVTIEWDSGDKFDKNG